MQAVIIVFPGTNREKDMENALKLAGFTTKILFHKTDLLPENTDLVVLPGGFSYGDYLRTGAMAAKSPIMKAIMDYAGAGGMLLGVCNGFQILCETGLLPGVLMPNKKGHFICKTTPLKVENNQTSFTNKYVTDEVIDIPIAHGDGNYYANADILRTLEDEKRILFRYMNNPNGSQNDIAGIMNKQGNILGMMPHPENHIEDIHENQEGLGLFQSLFFALSTTSF